MYNLGTKKLKHGPRGNKQTKILVVFTRYIKNVVKFIMQENKQPNNHIRQ